MGRWSLVTFLLFAITGFAKDKSITDKTIQSIQRSIIPIVCGYTADNGAFNIVEVVGSGFFVDGHGRFVTAGHVLDKWDEIGKTRHACFPVIYVPDVGWNSVGYIKTVPIQWFTFMACKRDDKVDLAICQPIENPFTSKRTARSSVSYVQLDTSFKVRGTPVAFTGFPLEFATPLTSIGDVGGYLSLDFNDTNFDYVVDRSAWGGASGSPLYGADGRVVGIILKRGMNDASGIAIARSAAVISDFLAKNPYIENKEQKGK